MPTPRRLNAACSALALGVAVHAASAQMPYDLAFSRQRLAEDRISVSPDGQWVAYTVMAPPEQSRSGARFTSTGIPYFAHGNGVFLTNVANARTTGISPPGHSCWRPAFSRDSRRVAFYCGSDSTPPQLHVHDLATQVTRRISSVAVGPKFWVGDEPQWSADGTEILVPLASRPTPPAAASSPAPRGPVVRIQRSGAEVVNTAASAWDPYAGGAIHTSTLAAINVATGAARTVVPSTHRPPPSVLQLSPTGKWVAYLSVFNRPSRQDRTYQDLAVVPLAGGESRAIAAIPLASWAPGYFTLAYSWHPTKDQLLWVREGKLFTTDDAFQPRQLAPALSDVTVALLAFTRDGATAVVGVRPLDMHDYVDPVPRALAVVPLNGRDVQILEIPPHLRFQSAVTSKPGALWQPDANRITVICRDAATLHTVIVHFDLRTQTSRVVTRSVSGLNVEQSSADHRTPIGTFQDARTPLDVYTFSADVAPERKLSDVEPRLASLRFGDVVTFQTTVTRFDGARAEVTSAMLFPQTRTAGKPVPTLVFHYPGVTRATAAREFGGGSPVTVPASIFTTRGYGVLLVDARIGPEGVAGNPIAELADVVLPQVRRAVELGYADSTRLALAGQSYGGYGTAALLTRTGMFSAAIAISGNYDLPGSFGAFGGGRWAESGQGRMGTHPWADTVALARYIENSPYYQASRITTPLLLVTGQRDVANASETNKLFSALQRLGRTVLHIEYEGEGHVVYDWSVASAADAGRRMVEFLDKYLRGPGS